MIREVEACAFERRILVDGMPIGLFRGCRREVACHWFPGLTGVFFVCVEQPLCLTSLTEK